MYSGGGHGDTRSDEEVDISQGVYHGVVCSPLQEKLMREQSHEKWEVRKRSGFSNQCSFSEKPCKRKGI
jgi:hypothetical protein